MWKIEQSIGVNSSKINAMNFHDNIIDLGTDISSKVFNSFVHPLSDLHLLQLRGIISEEE